VKDPARLHEHPSFAHFSPLHLHQLAECLSSQRLPAGATFFRSGDHSTDFFLVESGGVLLSSSTAFGKFHLRNLAPGEVFGAAGFLDGRERDADAEAMAETEVVSFNGIGLRAACERDRKFELALYWSLWKILSQELRSANARLGEFFANDGKGAEQPMDAPIDSDGTAPIDIGTKLEIFREQTLSAMEINFLASLSQKERFPAGQTFPLYSLAAILPLLPAKQRKTEPADWMTTDMEVACPDPLCGGRFRITRTGTTTFRHADVTRVPMGDE